MAQQCMKSELSIHAIDMTDCISPDILQYDQNIHGFIDETNNSNQDIADNSNEIHATDNSAPEYMDGLIVSVLNLPISNDVEIDNNWKENIPVSDSLVLPINDPINAADVPLTKNSCRRGRLKSNDSQKSSCKSNFEDNDDVAEGLKRYWKSFNPNDDETKAKEEPNIRTRLRKTRQATRRADFKLDDEIKTSEKVTRCSKRHQCNHCAFNSVTTAELLKHTSKVHNKNLFDCIECHKEFSSRKDTNIHMQIVHQKMRPYHCSCCDKKFGTSSNLIAHIKSVHQNERPYKCSLCKKSFFQKCKLLKHIEAVHDKVCLFKCSVCNAPFRYKSCLVKHVKAIHENIKPFKCNKCTKKFSDKWHLIQHTNVHKKQRPFVCQNCPQDFNHKATLEAHVKIVHEELLIATSSQEHSSTDSAQMDCTQKYNEQYDNKCTQILHIEKDNYVRRSEPYRCSHCDKDFIHKNAVLLHVKEIYDQLKPFKCFFCDKSFAFKNVLFRHIKTAHLDLKPFSCDYCEKEFIEKRTMVTHMKLAHDKAKPCICVLCKKDFCARNDLMRHMRNVHENHRPFECTLCGKSFGQRTTLLKHIKKLHNNRQRSPSFKCETCDKVFNKSITLNTHVNVVHLKMKPFKCSYCQKEFGLRIHVKRHIQSQHERSNNIKHNCQQCNKEFSAKSSLDRHILSVHEKLKNYSCNHCQKEFSRMQHLNTHIASIHEKPKHSVRNSIKKDLETQVHFLDFGSNVITTSDQHFQVLEQELPSITIAQIPIVSSDSLPVLQETQLSSHQLHNVLAQDGGQVFKIVQGLETCQTYIKAASTAELFAEANQEFFL